MRINLISSLDIISLLATVLSIALCLIHVARKRFDKKALAVAVLLVFQAGYIAFTLVEWLGITKRLDAYENYIGSSLPIWWLFIFYVLSQTALNEKLAANEQRLKFAIDATRDGIWDWNIRTGEVFYSPHWFTMLGYDTQDFPQTYTTWRDLLHPADISRAEPEVLRHFDLNEAFELEFRMRSKSGKWVWVMARGKVVERTPEGIPLRMAGTHVDISSRKEREARIKELQLYLSSIVDSMPSILIGIDVAFIVTLWNLKAEKATGLSAEEAKGMPLERAFPRLTKDIELCSLALQSGKIQTVTHRVHFENKEKRYENITVFPLKSSESGGIVIRLDDVTEETRIQETIIQSEKMLSLGGLAAGMAHEINTPLAVILNNGQNIERRLLGDLPKNVSEAEKCGLTLQAIRSYATAREIPAMLKDIVGSCGRAAKIVKNTLGFSRKSAQEMMPADLAALVESALELAVSEYELKRTGLKRIDVVREYEEGVPNVLCDGNKIQQVLFNILRNGVEAMAEKAYADESARFILRLGVNEGYVVLEIEDNGPGMEEDVREQVFHAFFSTKQNKQGTGLGLSISYFIITELHKGVLEVRSTPGRSTCFVIKLPMAAAPSSATPPSKA